MSPKKPNDELRVEKIRNGTVIDHITAGSALAVLRILRITGREGHVVSVLMNVPSKIVGRKDIVKIENRELDPKEVDKIALIAPNATINIIRNYEVKDKHRVSIPDELLNIVGCANPNCISNTKEPIETKFIVIDRKPLNIKCYYCEREPEDISSHII